MSPILAAAVVLVAGAAAAVAAAIHGLATARREALRERVRRLVHAPEPSDEERAGAAGRLVRGLRRLTGPSPAAPGADGGRRSRLRTTLIHAGLRGPGAFELFLGVKIALAVALALAVAPLHALWPSLPPNVELIAAPLAAVGFYAPNLWAALRVRRRQRRLARALPDALDLLVACLEAGLSIEASLVRIAHETAFSAPLLAGELGRATAELQAGMPRAEAFRRLADRTGLDELRSLSATLVQAEMFGTSIARSLRVHATTLRRERARLAEERAATVGVKLLLPLILCILPALLVVLMSPALIRVSRYLFGGGAGGG